MSEMNDLQAWKEALEKHGIEPYETSDYGTLWFQWGNYEFCLTPNDDDHSAAEFISLVTENVFTDRHYYEVKVPNITDLALMVYQPDRHDYRCIATGSSKRGALLNALQTKEAAS